MKKFGEYICDRSCEIYTILAVVVNEKSQKKNYLITLGT